MSHKLRHQKYVSEIRELYSPLEIPIAMEEQRLVKYLGDVLTNMPADWLNLTTHRLDIYEEKLAKTQFLGRFEELYEADNADQTALSNLPTAYDYIRLGHPLSSILEWTIAKLHNINPDAVIGFSSATMPVLAILRQNLLLGKNTLITYKNQLPDAFDAALLKKVYGYQFEVQQVKSTNEIPAFDGSIIFVSTSKDINNFDLNIKADFLVNTHPDLGSIILTNGEQSETYIPEIQHVRRRESIAITPANALLALQQFTGTSKVQNENFDIHQDQSKVIRTIQEITGTESNALVASSGLSMQYAIMMGLVHQAIDQYPGKPVKFVVPPNCYGGTNDQARRVAAVSDRIEIVDLPVDDGQDMVQSVDKVLSQLAEEDAIPYIIAEIPTNPRVEVPDLIKLRDALSKKRSTPTGSLAIEPVFILDQTFCPNVQFLGEEEILSSVKTIAYVSGSKFPSGGKCTAGYCVTNKKAEGLMTNIDLHLRLTDNAATDLQMHILAEQLPSMLQRIDNAYQYTREFVDFIGTTLPDAKINFVSEELAEQGFTPSVFSLDLPTKGESEEAKEAYKRALNLKLINLMIEKIPHESKFCVSYGQLKGCYWTIPATSTQGTTKEGDKDYIVRVALSANMDLERHKQVFSEFVNDI